MMRIKNEEDWIEPSVRSIVDFADEIIIVDNGSDDRTIDIIRELESIFETKIKLFIKPDLNQIDLSNYALSKTSYKYIMRWDGDMVARTSGPFNILHLRDKILKLHRHKYYVIYLSHIQLTGDLLHQDPEEEIHEENYLHTYSNKAKYIFSGKFESLKVPKYYHIIKIKYHFSFHINVKPARRMFQKRYWLRWLAENDYQEYPTLEKYINKKFREEYKSNNISDIEKNEFTNIITKLIPYNYEKFGEYPDLVIPYIGKSRYKIIYHNGKIIGRNDVL